MDRDKRMLLLLIVLVFIFVNYVAFTYFLKSKLVQGNNNKKEYRALEMRVDEINLKQLQLETMISENQVLKSEAAALEEKLPDYVDTPQVAYDFYNFCKQYGVSGKSLAFKLSEDAEENDGENSGYRKLDITLALVGEKTNMDRAIANLDSITKRKLNVEQITLSTVEGDSTGGVFSQIVFNQYITAEDSSFDVDKVYDFYK